MKVKIKHKKLILFLLIIVVIGIIVTVYYFTSSNSEENDFQDMRGKRQNEQMELGERIQLDENTELGDISSIKQEETVTLTKSCEVESSSVEEIELHAGYYLEEIYVEENEYVEEGSNILQYTNGTYLTAPYDCVITNLNLPDLEGKCLNSHYIKIESTNILAVTMKVDEEYIEKLKVGIEAEITVSSIGKTYTGYITHVASTASNGSFEIEIEFENDGDVKIGMSSTVKITI